MKGYELDKLLFQLKVELGNTTKTLAETETYPKIVALFNAQQQVSVEPVVMLKLADIEEMFNKAIEEERDLIKTYKDSYYGENALVRIAGYRELLIRIKSKFSA